MKIIIDTNIIHRDYHLHGKHILTLTDVATRLGYEVLIPEVVVDEIESQFCEEVSSAVDGYYKSLTKIVDLSLAKLKNPLPENFCETQCHDFRIEYEAALSFKKQHEVINGVKVTRLPIIPRGNNKIMLMLNYFSYLFVAWVWMLFHALYHKYDRVFVQQLSPVMMSAPGVLYKRIRKVPLYTWVLDLWPESLSAAGGINNKYVLGFFRHYVKSEYKHSDKILISSRSFEKSIAEYGDYSNKIVYYPQWADGNDSSELSVESLKSVESIKIPEGFKLMFAGAVGEAHGFECTMQAALLTKEHKDIKWVVVGDGRKLDWVRSFVKEHGLEETVFTLGRFPAETMPWFFKQADVMLVTLNDDPLFRLYAPAKISSYMAAAKPIVAVLNGEGAEVIKEADCGWSLAAGDAEGFAKLAIELSQMRKAVLEEKGKNALKYYKGHYIKEDCLKRLDELMELVKHE